MTEDDVRERLASFRLRSIHGSVYRATLLERDPLVSSFRGGRWVPPDSVAVLYTSTSREGALAELAFRLGLNEPISRKPVKVHRLNFVAEKALTITEVDLASFGVEMRIFNSLDYQPTQRIGLSAFQIGATALQVPCARWPTDNLVILDEASVGNSVELIGSETVNWVDWALEFAPHFLPDSFRGKARR